MNENECVHCDLLEAGHHLDLSKDCKRCGVCNKWLCPNHQYEIHDEMSESINEFYCWLHACEHRLKELRELRS